MGDISPDSFAAQHVPKTIKLEPQGSPSEIGGINLKCLVCDEDDAGRHYGSVCCSGCKGFFRRTVRFNKAYTCPYRNQCIIRKEYRNCCRACRYQKCLDCGLNPMLVHGDRGTTKFSKPSPSGELPDYLDEPSSGSSHALVLKGSNRSRFTDDRNYFKSEVFDLDPSSVESIIVASKFLRRDEKLPLGSLKIIPAYDPNDYSSISKYFMLVERLCDAYVDCELSHMSAEFEDKCSVNVSQSVAIREPRLVSQRSSMDWEPKFYITSKLLRQSWCRIVTQYLDWASHIPELQELDERDQELLVIGRSIPSCWILMGRKSVETNTPGLAVSGGAYMPYEKNGVEPDSIVMLMSNIIDVMMNEFIIPMRELDVTEAEYTLLRVICFFMPVPKLSQDAITKINEAKNRYIDAFTQVVQSSFPNMSMPAILQRISRLMLLIPVVEKVAQMVDDNFSMMALFNINEMHGLLSFALHVRKNSTSSDDYVFSSAHTSPKDSPLYIEL